MIPFGPVPSRRLGQSLGINNIPPKACTYDCIYCQVGETTDISRERRTFYLPAQIEAEVRAHVDATLRAGGHIDYLSFVPDGEPTLDVNLGEAIRRLRPLGIPIAVFTNATLIDREDVRAELALADWVSLKVDAVNPVAWRQINRPNKQLDLPAILEGMRAFADGFQGEITTETMLVRGINDGDADLEDTAAFVASLQPAIAYLAVPTRPPALAWVRPPDEATLHRAFHLFAGHVPRVEYLIGFAEAGFTPTGDARNDLLQITAVHPMRATEAMDYVQKCGLTAKLLEELVSEGLLLEVDHEGVPFYVRRFVS